MDEMVKHLEDIEGEFRSDKGQWENVASGFYCKKCRSPLLVGSHQCSVCGMVLKLTTPPIAYVKSLKIDKQWTFYSDRIDGEELERIKNRPKR